MVTIVYRADGVGPVCRRVCKGQEDLQFVRDDAVIPDGLVVRWGSVVPGDFPALNSAEAVALAKDKIATREALGDLAPTTWVRTEDIPADTTVVIRPRKHFGGNRFFVCSTPLDIRRAIRSCGRNGWYASELIDKAREFRVFVCQGRVVAVSERFPAENADGVAKIAWNLATGGRLINVRYREWPTNICNAAVSAAAKVGLDWSAIDAAVDKSGKPWIFEANTAPGLRNKFTINQIARVLVWAGSNPAPKKGKGETWQGLIHPALK